MKKLLSILLAIIMIVSLLPMTAAAEEAEDSVLAEANGTVDTVFAGGGEEDVGPSVPEAEAPEDGLPAVDTEEEEPNPPASDEPADGVPEDGTEPPEEDAEGPALCGEDLSWHLESGVLRISGTGDMYDFASEDDVPWREAAESIRTVELGDGVTGIGAWAFFTCTGLTHVLVPDHVVRIGGNAFADSVHIICAAGSAAEVFAAQNGNPFSVLVSGPAVTSAANAVGGVTVRWTEVEDAERYRVFRRTEGTDWAVLGDTLSCSYFDATAESGTAYMYTVQCVTEDGEAATSTFSENGASIIYIAAPVINSVSVANGGVHIAWGTVNGAERYRVFRKTGGGTWVRIGDTEAASFTDLDAARGTAYTYTVRCLDAAGAYSSSFDPAGKTFTMTETPVLTGATNISEGVRITWGAVEGAAKYWIYRKPAGGSWGWIGETASASFTDTKAVSGTEYSYTVRCVNAQRVLSSDFDRDGISVTCVSAPVISSVSAANSGIHITWGKVAGAVKYRVFRKTEGGTWRKIADTASTSYTDRTAAKGVRYIYTVRCLDAAGAYSSSFDAAEKPFTMTETPAITSVTNAEGGVRVVWGSVDGAVRYRVYRKTSDSGWRGIGDTAYESFTDRTAVSGTTYSYTVRCLDAAGVLTSDYDPVGKSVAYIAAPALGSIKNVVSGVRITWEEVTGASRYRVFRKTGGGPWERLTDTDATYLTDLSAVSGTEYTYTVRCIDETGAYISSFRSAGITITFVAAPAISSIGVSGGSVRIVWGKVAGAVRYRVYRKAEGGSWGRIGDTAAVSFADRTAEPGISYTYTVRGMDAAGNVVSDYDPSGMTFVMEPVPVLISAENVYRGVTFAWERTEGAVKYRVFRKTEDGSWGRIGDTEEDFFTDRTAESGVTYAYTVRCINAAGEYSSDYDPEGIAVTYVAAPVIESVCYAEDGVHITWGAVTGAERYRVYRMTEEETWIEIGETDGTSFTDPEAVIGIAYRYTVSCLDLSGECVSAYDPLGMSVYSKKIYLSPSNQDANTFITGNTNEGDVWYDVAGRLAVLLTGYDCEVYIADFDLVLDDRTVEAQEWGADVYIAMHSNAYVRPNSCWGVEVYYDANKSDSAERCALATALLNELSTLFDNRGLRTASNLKECRLPEMPSVIVECGYHDSVSDANKIINNKDLIAQLYCNAIVSYLGLVKKP